MSRRKEDLTEICTRIKWLIVGPGPRRAGPIGPACEGEAERMSLNQCPTQAHVGLSGDFYNKKKKLCPAMHDESCV
jgi:hypothetical protein